MVQYRPLYTIEFDDPDTVLARLRQMPIDRVAGLMETIAAYADNEYLGDPFTVHMAETTSSTGQVVAIWDTDPDCLVPSPTWQVTVNKVQMSSVIDLN